MFLHHYFIFSTTMRVIHYQRYGGPEVLSEGIAPVPEPQRGEVRVRVHAAAVNPKDVLVRKGKFKMITGRRFPQIPGYDIAGVVDAVGPGVRAFAGGDEVFGMIQSWGGGGYAEYAVLPVNQLARKPARLDTTHAAAIPLAALTALQALRDLAQLGRGEAVLLNGASGGVGTLAIQIAVNLGGRVTAVCSSKNRALVEGLGAHEVLPYDEAPLSSSGRSWDVIFDIFGSAPYPLARHLLRSGGRYVTAIPTARTVARDVLSRFTSQPARLVVVKSRRRDLQTLARWIDAGSLEPVIDRVLPLADAAEAHRHVETKRARGKVVLQIAP